MTDQDPNPRLRLTTTDELLRAVELGIVDKTEARSLLGLSVKRGRYARVQPRASGRFSKGDRVLPFNRFSAPAKEAMVHAQELARADGRGYIQTLDMLFAITRDKGSVSGRVLSARGIDEANIRGAVETLGVLAETSVEGIGPTLELKQAVERAFKGVEYPEDIGTVHLLLAMAGGEGVAGAVLGSFGLTEEKIRAEIRS